MSPKRVAWLAILPIVALSAAAHAGDKPRYAPAPDWVKPTPPLATGADAPAFARPAAAAR